MKQFIFNDVCCRVFESGSPSFILLQPTARHELHLLASEAEKIAVAGIPFVLAAFEVKDWTLDLLPWPDSHISHEEEAGKRASATLDFALNTLLPALENIYGPLPVVIGGFSLGGLFSLWASTLTDRFRAVAAASPTLWIQDWPAYSEKHPTLSGDVYLSLGDREEHVRNQAIARVGDRVRGEHHLLLERLGPEHCTLVWESGNHFTDNDGRLARAFAWCLGRLV